MTKLSTADLVAAKPSPEDFRRLPRFPIYTVCDNVRSLDNVGLIFRLSDAARVAQLYLCGITGYPPMENDSRPPHVARRAGHVIAKTAIQTVDYVPWSRVESAVDAVSDLKAKGVQIAALEQTTDSVDYTTAPYRFPVCLVLGHERQGVGAEILALSDLAVNIPVFGMGNSLNVASAYAIALYELLRRLAPSLRQGKG